MPPAPAVSPRGRQARLCRKDPCAAHSPIRRKIFVSVIFRASGGASVRGARGKTIFAAKAHGNALSPRKWPLGGPKACKTESGRARSFRPQGRKRRPFCDPVRASFFASLFVPALSREIGAQVRFAGRFCADALPQRPQRRNGRNAETVATFQRIKAAASAPAGGR